MEIKGLDEKSRVFEYTIVHKAKDGQMWDKQLGFEFIKTNFKVNDEILHSEITLAIKNAIHLTELELETALKILKQIKRESASSQRRLK